MTLEIPAEYEAIIRKAVSSGAFDTGEDAIRHALRLLEREQASTCLDAIATPSDLDALMLPEDLDPDLAAKYQRVGPIQDPDAGAAESWPDNEDFDAWLADLRNLRAEGLAPPIS
jgi:Arc/MetJ-type ribon-helix-helix transcriptional regulator